MTKQGLVNLYYLSIVYCIFAQFLLLLSYKSDEVH